MGKIKSKSLKGGHIGSQRSAMLREIMSVKYLVLGNLLLHQKNGINMGVKTQE